MQILKPLVLALAFFSPGLASSQNPTPNHLLGESSPYLQQHLYNPVDWYPWGPEGLEKAAREGKPIFLSIGYSTCHWCHVMEEESFTNDEIAAFLNKNFISIKVDREQRPDLDEQFMLVTQALTGSGGWPNSIFLSSDGDPFYAGTYFPPDTFLTVLGRISKEWQNNGDALAKDAAGLSAYIRDYMNRSAAARDITPEAVSAAARSLLSEMDEFNGGIGVAPKFPKESLFLFLLDQAIRDGDLALLDAVTNTLDGMIMGGIFDHVGGGFHRYSTDPEWHVPHFEKMLYNQAMIGRLLVRSWENTGKPQYKWAAIRTFDFVLREMQAPTGGFYAAQDADSLNADGEKVEGAYYIWTATEIREASSQAESLIEVFNIENPGTFEGANILYRQDLPDGDYAELEEGLEALRAARLQRPLPFMDRKIVVDWNAMMIETLVEAGAVFSRQDYTIAAEDAARYIIENMLSGDGLKRTSIDGVADIDAQLSDYAALGIALVSLHDYTDTGGEWLTLSERMSQEITTRFTEADGRFRMTETADGIGVFRPLDDGEIPAGNALTLALFGALSKRVDNPAYAQQATLLEAAIAGVAMDLPSGRAYTLKAAQDFAQGDTGRVRYLAGGAVRVAFEPDIGKGDITLKIQIKSGWHINAHVPLDEYFVATELETGGVPLAANSYPLAVVKSLGFTPAPLALYEGEIRLTGPLIPGETVLTLQACNDEICLAPEVVNFRVW